MMTSDATRTVERFYSHVTARSWDDLKAVLDAGVERIGPFGDRLVGRDAYLDFLRGTIPTDYRNDVLRITAAADGRSAFARVSEHLRYPERELQLEEVCSFEIAENGLISRIEVFWQTPDRDPAGFGSATSDASYSSRGSASRDAFVQHMNQSNRTKARG